MPAPGRPFEEAGTSGMPTQILCVVVAILWLQPVAGLAQVGHPRPDGPSPTPLPSLGAGRTSSPSVIPSARVAAPRPETSSGPEDGRALARPVGQDRRPDSRPQ